MRLLVVVPQVDGVKEEGDAHAHPDCEGDRQVIARVVRDDGFVEITSTDALTKIEGPTDV